MRVLVVEVNGDIASTLVQILVRHGVQAKSVGRLDAPRVAYRADAVLLDLGVSPADAVATCREIRTAGSVPVIVLTEHEQTAYRIEALRYGADDYLIKPYHIDELLARLTMAHRRRRAKMAAPTVLEHGDLRIDLIRQTVLVGERKVDLARKEFQILALIAAANGGICLRDQLVKEVWGRVWSGGHATLSVHLNVLRARLQIPDLIETVRGVGYRLSSSANDRLGGSGQMPVPQCGS